MFSKEKKKPIYLHSAVSADFPEPLLFRRRAQGHVLPGPRNTWEPWQAEMAAKNQEMINQKNLKTYKSVSGKGLTQMHFSVNIQITDFILRLLQSS